MDESILRKAVNDAKSKILRIVEGKVDAVDVRAIEKALDEILGKARRGML